MKIYIKDGETGRRLRLALPSRLLFGKFGRAIVKRAVDNGLKNNSAKAECVGTANIDADGIGAAELDDTTGFDEFETEEELELEFDGDEALSADGNAESAASDEKPTLTGAQVSELMKVILEMRRKHPGWVAVDVHSADGTEVRIKL